MKKLTRIIFNPDDYTSKVNISLFILRVVIGIFMLTHGIGKFEKLFLSDGPIQFADPLGVGAVVTLALVVFAEFFCSIFLILGLGTRIAGITLFINMIIIAFIIHANDGFGKQEFALLYALPYLMITLLGAGKYSIDYLMMKTKKL